MYLCLYHHDCMDGVNAAIEVSRQIRADFEPIQYGWDLSKLRSKIEAVQTIMFVDYCPTKDQCDQLKTLVKPEQLIIVLDHHKSAFQTIDYLLEQHPNTRYFLTEKLSGTGIVSILPVGFLDGQHTLIDMVQEDNGKLGRTNIPDLVPYLSVSHSDLIGHEYLINIRDLWVKNADFEDACRLNAYYDLIGLGTMCIEKAKTVVDAFDNSDKVKRNYLQVGEAYLNKKRKSAEALIRLGREFTVQDKNGYPIKILIAIGMGVGSELGDLYSSKYPGEATVTILTTYDLSNKNVSLVAGIRSSKQANGLVFAKLIDPVNGGGHVHACGGRLSNVELHPLNYIENLINENLHLHEVYIGE